MHCLHCFETLDALCGTLDALFWDSRCTVLVRWMHCLHCFETLDALFGTLDALFWDARCTVCTVLVR